MKYDLVIINGDSFSEGNGLCRQFEKLKQECKHFDLWNELKSYNDSEVFLDRCFSWGTKIAEILNVPVLNISKSGSSNKSILRRWYYIFGLYPNKNNDRILEYKNGDDHWGFFFPNNKSFEKFTITELEKYKNPLCITQWSNSYRGEIGYRSLIQTINPGFGDFNVLENWMNEYNIPLDVEKFNNFFLYYHSLLNTEYLVHYENANLLSAFQSLTKSKNYEGYSIYHRMANSMEFNYENVIKNLLPYETTKEIESNTYILKDIGIENLHYSLEGQEYFGKNILNLIENDRDSSK